MPSFVSARAIERFGTSNVCDYIVTVETYKNGAIGYHCGIILQELRLIGFEQSSSLSERYSDASPSATNLAMTRDGRLERMARMLRIRERISAERRPRICCCASTTI